VWSYYQVIYGDEKYARHTHPVRLRKPNTSTNTPMVGHLTKMMRKIPMRNQDYMYEMNTDALAALSLSLSIEGRTASTVETNTKHSLRSRKPYLASRTSSSLLFPRQHSLRDRQAQRRLTHQLFILSQHPTFMFGLDEKTPERDSIDSNDNR